MKHKQFSNVFLYFMSKINHCYQRINTLHIRTYVKTTKFIDKTQNYRQCFKLL